MQLTPAALGPSYPRWRIGRTPAPPSTCGHKSIGKIRLALSPNINHCWGSTFYVTTRGLTTSPIPYGTLTFAIDFDFIAHVLRITTSSGADQSFALEPMSVASFYRKTMQTLSELGIEVKILARPVEVEVAIPFEQDDQHS